MIRSEREYLQAKLELIQLRKQKEIYIENNKIKFWQPWPHQQKVLDFLNQGKKTVLLQGANRVGKTGLGVNFVGACCRGYQPWDDKSTIFGGSPIVCRILCADWEHHAQQVIVPALKEWIPADWYTTKKNNVGVEAFWTFTNGSTIELITHVQETKTQEGWKGHLVWADEPPPKDKYIANKRGLIDYSGIFLITMTAVYEKWLLTDLVQSNDLSIGYICNIPMRENPLLSQADIDNFERAVPEQEREARIYGGWLQLSGLVWGNFNRNTNIIPSFKIPPNWPVVAMIDFHPNKPQAIGFYAWDEYNREYVIDEVWEDLSPKEIAHEIVRRKNSNSWNITDVFIDPLAKGDVAYLRKQGHEIEDAFSIIEKTLAPYNIILSVASKDKISGVSNVNTAFKGDTGMPRLFITTNCIHHIEQISTWVYDPKTDKPKKEDDDFCENLYRSTLSGVKYVSDVHYSHEMQAQIYRDIGVV